MLKQHFRRMNKEMDENIIRNENINYSLKNEKDKKMDNKIDSVSHGSVEEEQNNLFELDIDVISDVISGESNKESLSSHTTWENNYHINNSNEKDIDTISQKALPRFDLDRVIDDFVFMCTFIGNDFLANIPHLDIADGSLNLMMRVYSDMLPRQLGGYLTNKSSIHLNRVELFVQEIGRREPLYFQQRAVDDKDDGYAGEGYREHYYQVTLRIFHVSTYVTT